MEKLSFTSVPVTEAQKPRKPLPSQAELLERFTYDPETGRIAYRVKHYGEHAGEEAGTLNTASPGKVYRRISFNGRRLYAHQAAYIMAHGSIPDGYVIDHDNRNTLDNSEKNLKAVPYADNAKNMGRRSDNKSGVTGVYRSGSKWVAEIKVNLRKIRLGRFTDLAEAAAVRLAAQLEHGFHPNHGTA